jgi:hypothetical protein
MEPILDLLYDDLAMSSLAIQFGVVGVLAAIAGLAWHGLSRAVHRAERLQPGTAGRR